MTPDELAALVAERDAAVARAEAAEARLGGLVRAMGSEILSACREHARTFPDPAYKAANIALGSLRRLAALIDIETLNFGNEEAAAILAAGRQP